MSIQRSIQVSFLSVINIKHVTLWTSISHVYRLLFKNTRLYNCGQSPQALG